MGGTAHGLKFGLSLNESWDDAKKRRNYEHAEVTVVEMDGITDDQADVDLVTGVPQIGDVSTVVTGAVCVSREFKEVGPRVWEIEATYRRPYKGDPDEAWADSFEWSWSFETVDEPLLWDAQDATEAIQNSAGEGLPPINTPIAIPVLTISRYESTFAGSTLLAYVNKVNTATFWGGAAGQVLCAGITATQMTIDNVDLWQVVYTFKFKMDTYGWKARLLDQGTYYWSGAVGTSSKKIFESETGEPVIGNLNGSGGQNTTTTPAFVSYNRYDDANFTTLSLTP